MIFHRAVRRELTHAAAGVFVALFAIMATTQLIRLLTEAAAGKVAPEAVAALLGFAALNYLPILLSLSMFIAILLTLSRSYRDSEMVVWFSSGLSLTAWVRPVMTFALPLVLAIALLSFLLSPWALSQSSEFREKLSTRNDAAQVSPGAFQEASSTERVVFVEAVADDASYVKNVFVSSVQNGRLGVTMAATGHPETADNGDRFLVLDKGRRYEVEPGLPDFRILEFARYAVRIETKEAQGIQRTPRDLPTSELWRENLPDYQAELLWRIGIPLSAVVLALLAIPLSFVNPRAGRSANMLLALFIYMIYSNLLSVSQAWVAQGKVSFAVGTLLVHVLMLALLPILFYRRIAVSSFLAWRR
ncbi:LPS export ABC transporter permease LptF [Rhodocyclus tenuis]|uniref:Lipopolysaccharide export system permease protein LptF n=2 Tax=Rhodocyclus TaxID=1064 RepID=A0A6L5JXY2_RHOTE|nr:LPS export ABC transporter permease LptF [Rhodocyclus gracilis]MQY51692.1 LPS export ABC transporter permease LptF [Rhodocyclus gracilis]MRD73173.1 LPS export ABC transporter permease LptF [Rhodocyclus gracilis]NJA89047.1 LPS export ABC transporter permease LptF [Rhodocyclus gracilis]